MDPPSEGIRAWSFKVPGTLTRGIRSRGVGASMRIPVGILLYGESETKVGTLHPQWVKDVGQLLLPLPIRKNSEVSSH